MSRKRRSYSPQLKFEVVMESLLGQKSNAEIYRERDIKESLLYKWKQEFLEQAPQIFEDKRGKQVLIVACNRHLMRLTPTRGGQARHLAQSRT